MKAGYHQFFNPSPLLVYFTAHYFLLVGRFLLAELGTSGTLDGTNTLVLKGRFQQKQMETVLRRYIRTFPAMLASQIMGYLCG